MWNSKIEFDQQKRGLACSFVLTENILMNIFNTFLPDVWGNAPNPTQPKLLGEGASAKVYEVRRNLKKFN